MDGETDAVLEAPHTVQAARALGWTNLLEVEASDGCLVRGHWGELRMERPVPEAVSHIGIRPEHVSLMRSCASLPARVRRIRNLGAAWALECVLDGGAVFEAQRPVGERVPEVGDTCRLCLPASRLIGLTTAGPKAG